ncbi:MAG: DUF1573 domain-containing protein [Chitinophagaceae bacterium]|nr:DUF1573 domain-containing protein [Chitinophagaceae bacterium]
MKKLFAISAALFLSSAIFAQNAQTKPDDIAKFTEVNHNFGKIKQGVPVTYYFEFKNVSDKPIVVENAHSSCGCTVPERPEAPVAPGETAKLKIVYNAAALGPINKEIFVKFAGVDIQKVLLITGEVVSEQSANTGAAKNPQGARNQR